MAEFIGKYKVTSSNGSKRQQSSVRVVDDSGVILACVYYGTKNYPLRWLRKRPHCIERAALVSQLVASGVPPDDVKMILAMPSKES